MNAEVNFTYADNKTELMIFFLFQFIFLNSFVPKNELKEQFREVTIFQIYYITKLISIRVKKVLVL